MIMNDIDNGKAGAIIPCGNYYYDINVDVNLSFPVSTPVYKFLNRTVKI